MDLISFALSYVVATMSLVTILYLHGELELRKIHLRRLREENK